MAANMDDRHNATGLTRAAAAASGLFPWTVTEADRNAPSPDFIERMRARFPTEREADHMLTRKMQRRAGPPFAGVSFDAMNGYIEALLRSNISGEFKLSDQRWFSGGASKIQMGFTLHWNEPGSGPSATRLVARMEPAES